jgi:hypothetical protein
VREGDLLLLKRTGGQVEAACDVGEVHLYHNVTPEEVADLARRYADGASLPYFERYTPPRNQDHLANVALLALLNVRSASLPPEQTPRRVMSGWVADFDPDAAC